MSELRNRIVQLRRYGEPDALEVIDAPLPRARATCTRFATWCWPAS